MELIQKLNYDKNYLKPEEREFLFDQTDISGDGKLNFLQFFN